MLGLGVSLSSSGGVSTSLSPGDISGLELWLKFNTGITGALGGATADSDMQDQEEITSWADQSGNDYHATQTNAVDRPEWDTATADIGGLKFTASAGEVMVLDGNFTVAAGDFTVMTRVKVTDLSAVRTVLGNTAANALKFSDTNTGLKALIGGSGASTFVEASETFATDVYYIITLTRSGTSDGNLEFRVHGGTHDDKSWDAAETNTADNDAFVIDNIGANAPAGSQPFDGVIKDILVWEGTALTAGQRNDMYTYIIAQE